MEPTTHQLSSTIDGIPLFVRTWTPTGTVRGILQFVHGLGEHGGRYQELADLVTEQGYAAVACDHRGHGRSGGLRGHVDGFAQYTADLKTALADTKERHGEAPLFLFGQSMGGLISIKFALDHADADLAGVLLSNPCLEVAVKAPKVKIVAGKLLSRILPKLRLDNELKTADLSHIAEVIKAYEEDPLVHRLISTRWYTSLVAVMDETNARADQLTLPSLWLIGDSDRICAAPASHAFAAKATDAEVRAFPDGFHEPHNDLCREDVHEALVGWINGRTDDAETIRHEATAG